MTPALPSALVVGVCLGLRSEWRDLPIFGNAPFLAARAAAEQDRFWERKQAIYTAARENAQHDLTEQKLIDFVEQDGVSDPEKFKAEMIDNGLAGAFRSGLFVLALLWNRFSLSGKRWLRSPMGVESQFCPQEWSSDWASSIPGFVFPSPAAVVIAVQLFRTRPQP